MNKFTLKFLNSSHEQQYQKEKMQRVRRFVFYFFMILGLILNLSKILIDFTQSKSNPEYVNYALVAIFLILVPISFKWPDKVQNTLAVGNIVSGLLQINFPKTTPPQRYYSYGSDYMQFQACAYFVSDFQTSLVQVFIHTLMKLGFTIYITNEFDPMLIITSVIAPLALSVVIYICDSNSRNQFLLNIKEDIWDQRLPEIIDKPFFRISFNDHQQLFLVLQYTSLDQFPGYDDEFCEGCNVRNLLRLYQDSSKTLETTLLYKKATYHQISLRGKNFKLRVCYYGIEKCECIIILDRMDEFKTPKIFKKITNYIISRSYPNQQQFNWGVISILLINDKTIGIIDLYGLLVKLNAKFTKKHKIEFIIVGQTSLFKSYTNLIRIFLIQIYQIMQWVIFIKLKQQDQINIKLSILEVEGSVKLQLQNDQYDLLFFHEYKRNIFIQQIEFMILTAPMDQNLLISFNTYLPFI